MPVYLGIITLFALIFDIMNGKESFGKKKRRVNFVVSNFVWYGVSIFFFFLYILSSMAVIWRYSFWIGFFIYIYFIIHFYRGMIIYNCVEQKETTRK